MDYDLLVEVREIKAELKRVAEALERLAKSKEQEMSRG